MVASVNYLEGLALVPNVLYGRCDHTTQGVVIAMLMSMSRGEKLVLSKANRLELRYKYIQPQHETKQFTGLIGLWEKTKKAGSSIRVFYSIKHTSFSKVSARHALQPRDNMRWVYAADMIVKDLTTVDGHPRGNVAVMQEVRITV
jgi:hypothetical protein